MKETLYNARGLDATRVKRAFGWIVTFRDFPAGSWQTVDGDSMMTEAATYFTKGRAEFYLDGSRRADRVPGVLSTEHEVVGRGGTFELRYVEPTTRVCIPGVLQALRNHGKLPELKQLRLEPGEHHLQEGRYLVARGALELPDRMVSEESTTFVPRGGLPVKTAELTLLLQFLN